MDDEKIIDLYLQRSDRAIDETAIKYGGVMYSVSYNILKNDSDAEECVNDAYLGIWKSIPPTIPASLHSFVCRVTRNKALDRYRALTAGKRAVGELCRLEEIADTLPSDITVESEIESRRITEALNQWLSSESKTNRYIFIRRYWFMDSPEDIAKNSGMSVSAVYSRIDRMKKRLYVFLREREVLI